MKGYFLYLVTGSKSISPICSCSVSPSKIVVEIYRACASIKFYRSVSKI